MIEETIGHDLVRHGIVKEAMLKLASEVRKQLPQKSVPEILFDLGSVSKDVLDRVAKKRIERVMSRLMALNAGGFAFELDSVDVASFANVGDVGWEVSKGLSPQYLLMEGARVYDEQMSQHSIGEDLSDEAGEESWGDEGAQDVDGRKDFFTLKSLTQELRFPSSTSEITLLILRFASDIFDRGVLFMVDEEELAGLGQFGLEIERADEKIRETVISFDGSTFLKGIIGGGQPYRGPLDRDKVTEALMGEIGEAWPVQVAFFPVIAENKVVALLYCDNPATGEDIGETEGLEIFMNQAGLALEKSLLQKRLREMQKKMGQ
jgi:hypothetical protein